MLTLRFNLAAVGTTVLTIIIAATATAAPIASDSFDTYGLGGLAGENGGSGWGNAWSAHPRVQVVSGGLSYASGDVIVDGGSQSVEIVYDPAEGGGITDGIMSRALDTPQTGTVYMSLLFLDTVNPDFNNDFAQWGFDDGTANPKASVMRRNGTLQSRSTTSSSNSADSGIAANVGQTFLLVFKAEKSGSTYDSISLFVNPSTNIEPGVADAEATANSGLSSLDNFVSRTAFHELNDAFKIDAISIGTTFEDVVPIPEPTTAILGLVGVGACLLRRRA